MYHTLNPQKINGTKFAREHQGKFVTKANFAQVFLKAWEESNKNKQVVVNGFALQEIISPRHAEEQIIRKEEN